MSGFFFKTIVATLPFSFSPALGTDLIRFVFPFRLDCENYPGRFPLALVVEESSILDVLNAYVTPRPLIEVLNIWFP
jgi:hypothetical protein